jgi:predicted ATPase
MRPEDAGTGVSQVLPIVADLSASAMGVHRERAGWLTMDHPEAHLHPRAQVELGDLFIRAANGGGKYLIETHSEHLLLRLLRRIDETNSGKLPDDKHQLRPDDVSINYVWRRDGEIIVRHLPVDQSGEFLEMWPEGFFMERLDELIY